MTTPIKSLRGALAVARHSRSKLGASSLCSERAPQSRQEGNDNTHYVIARHTVPKQSWQGRGAVMRLLHFVRNDKRGIAKRRDSEG